MGQSIQLGAPEFTASCHQFSQKSCGPLNILLQADEKRIKAGVYASLLELCWRADASMEHRHVRSEEGSEFFYSRIILPLGYVSLKNE